MGAGCPDCAGKREEIIRLKDQLEDLGDQIVDLNLQIAGKDTVLEAYRDGKVEDGQARIAAIRLAERERLPDS